MILYIKLSATKVSARHTMKYVDKEYKIDSDTQKLTKKKELLIHV